MTSAEYNAQFQSMAENLEPEFDGDRIIYEEVSNDTYLRSMAHVILRDGEVSDRFLTGLTRRLAAKHGLTSHETLKALNTCIMLASKQTEPNKEEI